VFATNMLTLVSYYSNAALQVCNAEILNIIFAYLLWQFP
jgi:hypothetical protein